ncbi:MAG: flagellar biosynthetic protein FliR [Brevinematales bacterium]|nr:flagellar biosynthetic protein FliR [Brevinematales bacterium]
MNVYDIFNNYFQIFLIILVRCIGIFVSAPFFSGAIMPFRFKLGFAFFLGLIATPIVLTMGVKLPEDLAVFGVAIVSNFVFGVAVGFFAFFIVSVFQQSAQIFSLQMGLGMNEVVDPVSDVQVPAIGNILGILILLIFLRLDGHFYFVNLIVESFRKVDLIDRNISSIILKGLTSALIVMFEVSIKIALPIIAVTILLDIAMGLISRVAPQFNVMIMGFNLKMLAGFVVVWFLMPILLDVGESIVMELYNTSLDWVNAMGIKVN